MNLKEKIIKTKYILPFVLGILAISILAYHFNPQQESPKVEIINYNLYVEKVSYIFPQLNITIYSNDSTMWVEKVELYRLSIQTDEATFTPFQLEKGDRLTFQFDINGVLETGETIKLGLRFREWLDIEHAPYKPYRMMIEVRIP